MPVIRNTVKSIRAAMEEYDGCEFDVRLTRDRVPVLYHNARLKGRKFLDLPSRSLEGRVDRFKDLLEDGEIIDLVNEQGKTLWIEMKEDTYRGGLPDDKYSRTLAKRMPGFHWMTGYGDYMRELGYALKKVGIKWENLTPANV